MAICWSDRDQGPFFQNGKLLAERDGVKRRSEELALEKDILKVAPSSPYCFFSGFNNSVHNPGYVKWNMLRAQWFPVAWKQKACLQSMTKTDVEVKRNLVFWAFLQPVHQGKD